jgi:hypothetical protein
MGLIIVPECSLIKQNSHRAFLFHLQIPSDLFTGILINQLFYNRLLTFIE